MLERKTYKNWKEICEAIGWKTTGGTYKQARLKELDTLCRYHKEGRTFIVDEIYENAMPSLSSGKLSKDIQLLLINILHHHKDEIFDITNNNLMTMLNMVNPNYKNYYNNKDKLSKDLGINVDYCYEIYSMIARYKTIIRNAIEGLSKKKLLSYNIVDIICYDKEIYEYVNENQVNKTTEIAFRKATVEESDFMLKIEKEELSKLKYNSVKDLYFRPKEYEKYMLNVNNRLKEYGINYKYKSYELIYNKKNIRDEFIINEDEIMKTKLALNNNVFDSILKTITKRKDNISTEIYIDLYSKKELIEKFNLYDTLPYEKDYVTNCIDVLSRICKNS